MTNHLFQTKSHRWLVSLGDCLMLLTFSVHMLTLVLSHYARCHFFFFLLLSLDAGQESFLLEGCFYPLIACVFHPHSGFFLLTVWMLYTAPDALKAVCFSWLDFFQKYIFFFYLQHVVNISRKQAHVRHPCGTKARLWLKWIQVSQEQRQREINTLSSLYHLSPAFHKYVWWRQNSVCEATVRVIPHKYTLPRFCVELQYNRFYEIRIRNALRVF